MFSAGSAVASVRRATRSTSARSLGTATTQFREAALNRAASPPSSFCVTRFVRPWAILAIVLAVCACTSAPPPIAPAASASITPASPTPTPQAWPSATDLETIREIIESRAAGQGLCVYFIQTRVLLHAPGMHLPRALQAVRVQLRAHAGRALRRRRVRSRARRRGRPQHLRRPRAARVRRRDVQGGGQGHDRLPRRQPPHGRLRGVHLAPVRRRAQHRSANAAI